MAAGSLTLLGAVCLAWLTLAGRRALEMSKDADYRASWGWAFWALVPASLFAVLSFSSGGGDVTARNITLGALGALMGAAGLIWAGYWWDSSAKAQPPAQMPGTQPAINAPNNQGIVTQGQSGGTNIINPGPIITASPQVQSRSNDPAAPWQTMFTISTTVPVQTGDLRLTCNGPCLKAGIGRINKFGISTGSNGPVPGDPNSVIYELAPETLVPGQNVAVGVFSMEPVTVVSGMIGAYKINF